MVVEWLAAPVRRLREWLSRVFSPRVEDSLRLRGLGLAALWLAALGLLWVGGNPWLTLGGGGIGTLGHWVSWRRRNLQSRAWSLLIAALAIGLSFAMRSQMLEVFNGNWIPLGHFLVLVMALATFDLRTRGGLYAGLVLSGLVLFFASQQAFAPIFGVFLAGFAVLLLAFLSLAFLEDGVRDAQVHWVHRRLSGAAYWGGTACAVFLLSALAFWLMPRGQDSLIGAPQVAVLPVTGGAFPAPIVQPADISPVVVGDDADGEVEDLFSNDGKTSSTADGGGDSASIPDDAFQVGLNPDGDDDVEFYVRSKVASYWRGLTLDVFDGRYWRAGITRSRQFQSPDGSRIWYNRDSFGLDNRIQYDHTFFIQHDQPPDALFMGYRGLRIVGENGSLAGDGLQGGDTYRVRSAYPELDPQRLRLDHSRGVTPLFTNLPSGSQRLEQLAQQITRGAGSDFERAKLIVSYLGQWGEFDPRRPGDLTSSAPLDQFLFEGKAGSTLDFATATVMLARASGLPARLAVGYLPGGRDSLSGAYQVRESDSHAWAEIFFADHGWVPFDSTPRSKEVFPGGVRSGVGRLFQGGPGEDLYSAVKAAPSQLGGFLGKVLGNPMLSILMPLLVGGLVLLRWLYLRSGRGNQTNRKKGWLAYSSLPGEGRRDLLHIYAQVERLLRRRWRVRRMPWQTVGDYTALAADSNQDLQGQLSWFAQATWQAAYNPGELPAGLVQEARSRLARLKAALKTMKGLATLQ